MDFFGLVRQSAARQGWSRVVASSALAALILVGVAVATLNVRHYVEWQSLPQTRRARYIYITTSEFPRWAADIVDRVIYDRGITNLGVWRQAHPIADPANPIEALE